MYISLDDDGMTLYLVIFYDAQAFGLLVNDILSLLVYFFFLRYFSWNDRSMHDAGHIANADNVLSLYSHCARCTTMRLTSVIEQLTTYLTHI